jgi:hypothetical protein
MTKNIDNLSQTFGFITCLNTNKNQIYLLTYLLIIIIIINYSDYFIIGTGLYA